MKITELFENSVKELYWKFIYIFGAKWKERGKDFLSYI